MMDTSNRFFVSASMGSQIVVHALSRRSALASTSGKPVALQLSPEEALNLAAWLTAIAEPFAESSGLSFNRILEEIKRK